MKANNDKYRDKDGCLDAAQLVRDLSIKPDMLAKEFLLCRALIKSRFAMDKIGHLTIQVSEGEYFLYPKLHADKGDGYSVEVIKDKDIKKKIKEIEDSGKKVINHTDEEFQNRVINTNILEISAEKIKKEMLAGLI